MKNTNRLKKIINFFDIINRIGYVFIIIGFVSCGILAVLIGILSLMGGIDWSLGLNTTLYPNVEELTIFYVLTSLLTLVEGFVIVKTAKEYFSYAKANSPFSKTAADKLRKYAKINLIASIAFILVYNLLELLAPNYRETVNVYYIVNNIASDLLVFVLLYLFADFSERFENLNESDVNKIKRVYSTSETKTKKLTLGFAISAAISLAVAILFQVLQLNFEIALSDILFDSTSAELPECFIALAATLLSFAIASKLLNEYFAKANEEGTIFGNEGLTLLKKKGIALIIIPIALSAICDIILLIAYDYIAIDVAADFSIFIALAMFVLRIGIYAKQEQIELLEVKENNDNNTSPSNDPDSPFLN